MNVKQLLDKLAGILNDERHAQIEKYKSLKKVLKALRNEKVALHAKLEYTQDEAQRQEIESRLKIVTAQRKKGLLVLKELKKEKTNGEA